MQYETDREGRLFQDGKLVLVQLGTDFFEMRHYATARGRSLNAKIKSVKQIINTPTLMVRLLKEVEA